MDYCIAGDEPKVEKAILHLFKNQLFTDVTVKYSPGNAQFRVHKLILALYSPVLCDNFYGKPECNILNIEGSELAAVKNMISFCYGEPPVFKNISEIKETKAIAEKYKIVELLNICINEIDTVKVDTSNVLTVLEMSVQYGNEKKESECLEIVSRNRETVFASELFMKMKFELVIQIFEKLRDMGFLTEVQYLRSAIEWMKCEDSENKEKLMKRIEITKLRMDEFVDIVISFPNFFTNAEIAKAFKKIKETIKDTSPKEQNDTLTQAGADDPSSVQYSMDFTHPLLQRGSVLSKSNRSSRGSDTSFDLSGLVENNVSSDEEEELTESMELIDFGIGKVEFNNLTSRADPMPPPGLDVLPMPVEAMAPGTSGEVIHLASTVDILGKTSSPSHISEISHQKCNLTISILDGSEDVKQGRSEDVKQAIITIEDRNFRRGLKFYVTEDLKDGIFLQLLSQGNGDYVFNDMDLTYDSVYFLLKYLQSGKQMLSPLNYIEVLKAAFHFKLQKVRESCIEKLSNVYPMCIVCNFDPVVLDGLVLYPVFSEKIKPLIISNTMDIILHPNFVDCSVNLMRLILSQRKLNLSSELQLLLVTIPWLEARNRRRWDFRSCLLNEIAFENVNHIDVEYTSNRYPKFFTKDEIDSILSYKQSNNSESKESLPRWYSFKQREYLRGDSVNSIAQCEN